MQYGVFKSAWLRRGRLVTTRATVPAKAQVLQKQTRKILACRLRAHLQARASLRLPMIYREAAKSMLLLPPNTIRQLAEALEQLMVEDAAAKRPFIAAMVISNWRGGIPALGFFDCAAQLGRFSGDAAGPDARVFHTAELNAVFDLWLPPSDEPTSETPPTFSI